MPEPAANIDIRPAMPSQWAEALFLLFREYPPATRTRQLAAVLAAARAGTTSLQQLYIAAEGERIVGVIWANVLPGRMGALWPPQFRDDSNQHDDIAGRLIAAAEAAVLQSSDLALWQSSLDPAADADSKRLTAVGYAPLTVLAQMLTTNVTASDSSAAHPLHYARYGPADLARLCETIEATYLSTLDCPELDSLRSTADCVAGYREIGTSADRHWYLVEHAGSTVGCLLLARHDENQFELVYMGLEPGSRQRGWGGLLVSRALQIVREAGGSALVTSVDERNHPAIALYERAGFSTWQRRLIMVKQAG